MPKSAAIADTAVAKINRNMWSIVCATLSSSVVPRECATATRGAGTAGVATGFARGVARLLTTHQCDGVVATNTTIAREGVAGLPHADETGGLSGAPLRAKSTAVIRTLARALDGALPIIGVGGILSAEDAREKVAAGASLVQIYTGLIYRGPQLIADCVKALDRP